MDKFKNENMKSENEMAKQFKKWKLKTITAEENDAIRKQCYKQVQAGKRMKQEFDTVKYLELLADKCIVYPDLHDVKLQDFYKEMDSIKVLKKHLLILLF